jgi:hypothetical protein
MLIDAADACYQSEVPSLVITSGNGSRRRIPVHSTGGVLGREENSHQSSAMILSCHAGMPMYIWPRIIPFRSRISIPPTAHS